MKSKNLDMQKSILLIVGVLVAGLLIGSAFSTTGEAVRKRRLPGGGGGGGSVPTMDIRDGDFISKDNYLFSGDSSCFNNDPNDMDCWKFRIGELYSGPPTVGNINEGELQYKGPTIGIENDFTMDDDRDNPPGIGLGATTRCINLPNSNIAKICLESLSVADSDYNTYEVRYDNSKDLSNGGAPSQTSEPVIEIAALEGLDNGLIVVGESIYDFGPGFTSTSRIPTDKIWLHMNDSFAGFVDVFYEDIDNRVKWAGSIDGRIVSFSKKFAEVNYMNTLGNNIQLKLEKQASFGVQVSFRLKFDVQKEAGEPLYADDLVLLLKNSTNAFAGFGNLAEVAEAGELTWNFRNIGTKDEDHRTAYGIIIKAPDFSLASDTLILEIPADQVKARVQVIGCKNINGIQVCGGEEAFVPLNSTINDYGSFIPILDYNDIWTLQDSNISFGRQYYDIHDELDLGIIEPNSLNHFISLRGTGPRIVTSLTSSDDDYLSGVFMEVPRRTITYSYLFDQSIPLNTTSTSKPLEINMLGKRIRIIKINSPSSFTIEKVPQ